MKNRFAISVLLALSLLLTACGSPATIPPAPTGTALPAPTETAPAPTQTLAPPAAIGNVKVIIDGFAFSPANVTVTVGSTVTWENMESATHKIVADDASFTSENLSEGGAFSFTFTVPGSFPYRCGIHGSMKGTITVVP